MLYPGLLSFILEREEDPDLDTARTFTNCCVIPYIATRHSVGLTKTLIIGYGRTKSSTTGNNNNDTNQDSPFRHPLLDYYFVVAFGDKYPMRLRVWSYRLVSTLST